MTDSDGSNKTKHLPHEHATEAERGRRPKRTKYTPVAWYATRPSDLGPEKCFCAWAIFALSLHTFTDPVVSVPAVTAVENAS